MNFDVSPHAVGLESAGCVVIESGACECVASRVFKRTVLDSTLLPSSVDTTHLTVTEVFVPALINKTFSVSSSRS